MDVKVKKSLRRAGGIKTTKNKLLCPYGCPASVGAFPIEEGIDRADLRIVVLVGFNLIVAVEVLDIGDRVIQFQITADVGRHSFKLIIPIGSIGIEGQVSQLVDAFCCTAFEIIRIVLLRRLLYG